MVRHPGKLLSSTFGKLESGYSTAMKCLLVCLLTWGLSFADTFGAGTDWNTGYVTMPDGRKLDGQLNYNWKAEVLQVKLPDGILKAFSAARLHSFAYYDNALNQLRKFVAVDVPGEDESRRTVIMEECAVGKLSVYRHLRHTHELIKVTRPSMFGQDKDLVKDYDNFTYVVVEDGRTSDLQAFASDLWPRMTQQFHQPLINYVRLRQLDISTTIARLMLINEYNYLISQADESADHSDVGGATETGDATEILPAFNGGQ